MDKILTSFFKDHNYAVREQTIKSLVECKDIVGGDLFFELLKKHLGVLSGEANYIYRVTASSFLR